MLRYVFAIVFMTVLGLAVVQLRWAQNAAHAELHRLEAQRLKVRRVLWAQQLRLNGPIVPDPDSSGDPVWALELAPPGAGPHRRYLARTD
ncbi:MAG: hypothetical protein ACYS5V_04495 [Planctomycetota bacterium]|jgi:hypothetical protein